jgi:mono/diheme cytochrome c family protein
MHAVRLARRALLAFLLLALAACRRGGDDGGGKDRPPPPEDAGPLTAAEISDFHHLAEGSELIPTSWARALRNPDNRRQFFLDNPQRFGLMPDPSGTGLPIGLTDAETVDLRFTGMKMMGFNCAACHSTEISHGTNRLRIDGAPARFNGYKFNEDLKRTMLETATNPLHLLQFVADLLRQSRQGQPQSDAPSDVEADAGADVQGTEQLDDTRRPDATAALEDLSDATVSPADRAMLESLAQALREDSAANPPVDLHRVPMDSAHPNFQRLEQRYSAESVQAQQAEIAQDAVAADALPSAAGDQSSLTSLAGAWNDVLITARMLRDRAQMVVFILGGGFGTDYGPGRVDAFGVARNRLYPNRAIPLTAPVSFPHLWGFSRQTWLHWDANTNSVMERNLGQALGLGGVFDPVTLRSTLNPVNLHRLEMLSRRLTAPAWPAFFPAIDTAQASRGKPLYGQYCAGCHRENPADVCYPLNVIGTDSMRAANFALPMGNGTFTDSVGPLLMRMKYVAYQTFQVPRAEWPEYNGIPDSQVVWRVTKTYAARPLDGIWATAPFLHNGSVPSLWELLLPAAQRSTSFPLGQPEYDPRNVGFRLDAPNAPWRFDTSQPGNGNGGHEYGTTLPERERRALVEYIKTLGRYDGPVTPQQGGIRCPSLQF